MEGEEFIPCKYEEIYPFERGIAKVKGIQNMALLMNKEKR